MIFFREFARATPFIGLKDFKITWGILFQWPDSAARRAPVSGVLITTSVGRRGILEPEPGLIARLVIPVLLVITPTKAKKHPQS